jgi:hypothetical protein
MSDEVQTWSRRRTAVIVALLALGLTFVCGGYADGWQWTGLSSDVALWDWLVVLALPLTVGVLPLLLEHRRRLEPRHQHLALTFIAAFAALVLAGYLVPLEWTGFTGNTLWDWLELALLPIVLATATLWPGVGELRTWHRVAIGVGAVAFLAIVVAGYAVPLEWTGFSDNKGWDWVRLLLLPLLVPTLVLPRLEAFLATRVVPSDEDTTAAHAPGH